MYPAYEETKTTDLRLNVFTGTILLEQKTIVRYNFDRYVDVWGPITIVSEPPIVRTKEQGGKGE